MYIVVHCVCVGWYVWLCVYECVVCVTECVFMCYVCECASLFGYVCEAVRCLCECVREYICVCVRACVCVCVCDSFLWVLVVDTCLPLDT